MTKRQLEHILRAAGAITGENEIVVIGSQSILGSYPDAPAELCQSMEADTFPLHATEKADLIDGTIGELSPFHETHGYYAHGLTPDSAVLADGWKKRLVRLQSHSTEGVIGYCLSPADLAVSKLAAGRDKDIAFVSVLLAHHYASVENIRGLAATLPPHWSTIVLQNLMIAASRKTK